MPNNPSKPQDTDSNPAEKYQLLGRPARDPENDWDIIGEYHTICAIVGDHIGINYPNSYYALTDTAKLDGYDELAIRMPDGTLAKRGTHDHNPGCHCWIVYENQFDFANSGHKRPPGINPPTP